MKLKICNLLRVTTYLTLATAIFILSWFLYHAYLYRTFSPDKFILYTSLVGSVLQIIFTIAVISLMHYYVPEQKVVDKPFLIFFQIITILNVIVAAALSFLFLLGLKESFFANGSWKIPGQEDAIALSIIGSYTVVSIYTLAGATKLKKAILHNQQLESDSWLEELGQSVTT